MSGARKGTLNSKPFYFMSSQFHFFQWFFSFSRVKCVGLLEWSWQRGKAGSEVQMKCLLVASESAEVLFHWTDLEYQQNIQERYGAAQEEGEEVRRWKKSKASEITVFSQFNLQLFVFLSPWCSFLRLRTSWALCSLPSSSPTAPWRTATPPSLQKTTTSTCSTRYYLPFRIKAACITSCRSFYYMFCVHIKRL